MAEDTLEECVVAFSMSSAAGAGVAQPCAASIDRLAGEKANDGTFVAQQNLLPSREWCPWRRGTD